MSCLRRLVALLGVTVALAAPALAQPAAKFERLGLGGSAPNTTSPLVIDPADVPANTAGQNLLFLDGSGNTRKGTLAKGDLPAVTVFTDQANTFGAFLQTFGGDVAFGGHAGTSTYASQATGWRVTTAGAADFRYLYTDEMHAKAFIADLELALNGGQIIAKSTATLASAFTCPAAGATATLTVNDFPGFPNLRVFAASDWVVLRTFSRTDADSDGNTDLAIGDCVGQVSAYVDGSGTQSWTFTRGSGGNAGAMAASTVVAADAPVIDFGVSGQGFLIASANDGAEGANSPYWQVVTWTTAPVAANMTVVTRWGNLNGSYGVASPTYGFAAGNPAEANTILTGTTWKLRDGTTDKLVLDGATGNLTLTGSILLSTGGSVTSTGAWSLTNTGGLLFDDSSSDTDYVRMIRWSSGAFMRGSGGLVNIKTAPAFDGGYGQIFMEGSASVGGEVKFYSFDGVNGSNAQFQANSSGGSTLLAGNLLPWNGSSNTDDVHTIGTSATRYKNINLALPNNTSPAFVIVNKGGGGGDQFSALGYVAGVSKTFTIGCGTITFTVGLLTGTTCP